MSMPGERLGNSQSPVIKLILAMEEWGKRFPGFEREVHGIEVDEHGAYWMRAVVEERKDANVTRNDKKEVPPTEPQPNTRLSDKPVRRSTE